MKYILIVIGALVAIAGAVVLGAAWLLCDMLPHGGC